MTANSAIDVDTVRFSLRAPRGACHCGRWRLTPPCSRSALSLRYVFLANCRTCDSGSRFRVRVPFQSIEVYSFEPHKLKEAEMKAKSDQLDRFWTLVKLIPKTLFHC